ncbi:MAG: branched-chain amino acid ABC transporter substrate-binding protein, partial [Betaproteobacteria bacterium]|nr:branched-chain amino acid ABC transporter substrate-binding protein [Betaproteobacteria bacterium]
MRARTWLAASALAAFLIAPAQAADMGTQPVNMPADWYSCKQTVTNDCESIAAVVVDMDSRDVPLFTKLTSLAFNTAKGSRAQLIEALGYPPQYDRRFPTGVRQYLWQQSYPGGDVEAGVTILTFEDRIISIGLLRFSRYNLLWSPKHPSPPLATLEESTERRSQVNLKRIRPPGTNAADAVRIGFAGTLSPAPVAFIGTDLERGVRMAVEEINARGGVQIGNRRRPLELLIADDKRDPAEARRVAEAMNTAGAVAVIGHSFSVPGIPAATVYAKNNLALVQPVISNPLLYGPDARQSFRVIATDDRVVDALFQYVSKDLMAKSVAIVYEKSMYGERYARSFSSRTVNALINTVSYDAVPSRPASLAALVKSIAEKQPDAVFYAGAEQAGGKLLAELAQAGLSIPVVGIEGVCATHIAALAGNGIRLLTCGLPGEWLENLPLGWRYAGRFSRRFDGQNTTFSMYAYDAVQVIVAAIERASSLDKTAIIE